MRYSDINDGLVTDVEIEARAPHAKWGTLDPAELIVAIYRVLKREGFLQPEFLKVFQGDWGVSNARLHGMNKPQMESYYNNVSASISAEFDATNKDVLIDMIVLLLNNPGQLRRECTKHGIKVEFMEQVYGLAATTLIKELVRREEQRELESCEDKT